ncbi:MAG: hypothetical protein H7Y20_06420 [Bryobacteraceae bacterium]|nr:hypothetical protein [Bryobacteraceae bacterium]
MSRHIFILLLAFLPASAQTYEHRLTGSFGALNPAGGAQSDAFNSAPMLSFDYGLRFHRFSQADLGVDIAFASQSAIRGSSETRRNIYIPRFGYRAVIPLLQDRLEASIGAGGAHSFIKPTIPGSEIWLVYGQVGASYAIDRDKHYRGGLMLRWYRDPIGTPVQQFISVGAEFTYSFGR